MKKAALALVFVAGGALALPAPRLPGPARADYTRSDREAEDARCVKCHAQKAREHAASLHRASFEDATFQRAYAIDHEAFCRSCHAPEARPDAEPDAFARSHGVACVTCHVPEPGGAVLASRESPKAPHAVRRVEGFGTASCARCHEFTFPGGDEKMQRTMSEHAASAARDRSCASCHMKEGSHAFPASRDADLLARSVEVEARRDGSEVSFTLRARDVGHAMPTGDLFRRLVLRVQTRRGVVERPFARTFRGHTETNDTRLAPERRVVLDVPDGPIAWSLVHQRVISARQAPPYDVTVDGETPLAQGAL